jgi:hypothetical protein
MRKKDFNLEGLRITEGTKAFNNDEAVQEFYDYLQEETKETFQQRKKSNRLANEKYISRYLRRLSIY